MRIAGIMAVVVLALAGAPVEASADVADAVRRVLTLQDYNTRVVVLGTCLLGLASGVMGSFLLLRKRSLLGDAISHATLPGIAAAFMVMVAAGGTGKDLGGLLLGAAVAGLAGIGAVHLIRTQTRLKEDAALGIVLSVFFGLGIALLGLVQKMSTGSAAGLESFIYGKTASMLASDAQLIGACALVISAASFLLFKEFKLLCFDSAYAASLGWPVWLLDSVMMVLVVGVTVIGLQAVGLILVMALLVIPAAAARFWTERLDHMILISAAIGAVSAGLGAAISATAPRLPAGGVIVLAAAALFFASMLVGRERGVIRRWVEHVRLNRRVARQHLLRAIFELVEESGGAVRAATWNALRRERSWSATDLQRVLIRAMREGLVAKTATHDYVLTDEGRAEARRLVNNHRLWELFLITHADIAPSHVDRGADEIEHVLGRAMTEKLEALLAQDRGLRVPPSPHPLGARGDTGEGRGSP